MKHRKNPPPTEKDKNWFVALEAMEKNRLERIDASSSNGLMRADVETPEQRAEWEARNLQWGLEFCNRSYESTKNPRYIWEAIVGLTEANQTEYPEFVRQYLGRVAKNLLEKCNRKPGGDNGIIACLEFFQLSDLWDEDRKESQIYWMMREKIDQKKSRFQASLDVENELDQGGRKPGERGYWGASKIEKCFREIDKIVREMLSQEKDNI